MSMRIAVKLFKEYFDLIEMYRWTVLLDCIRDLRLDFKLLKNFQL